MARRTLSCPCKRGEFNCAERIRRYIDDGDQAARDELTLQMMPVIERTVAHTLPSWLYHEKEDLVNAAIAEKFLEVDRLRKWGNQCPYCAWVAIVTRNYVLDWFKTRERNREKETLLAPVGATPPSPPDSSVVHCIHAQLENFPVDHRLTFAMKYSYLDPTISEIAQHCQIKQGAVFARLKKMRGKINASCGHLFNAEFSAPFEGVRHPYPEFDLIGSDETGSQAEAKPRKEDIGACINESLRSYAAQEQLAYYLQYSPLALPLEELASGFGEDAATLREWIDKIDTTVKASCCC